MAINEVAEQWGLDPGIVERWTVRDFLNRQEYKDIRAYIRALNNG